MNLRQRTQANVNQSIADVARIVGADRVDVVTLISVAGLDPASDFRFENWSGVSFANMDLTGFDFTGARLHGCDFKGAKIEKAIFHQCELGRVLHRPGRDPHLPAETTAIGCLRDAVDWSKSDQSLVLPSKQRSDRHLPVGALFQDAVFAPEMVVVPAGTFKMGSLPGELGSFKTADYIEREKLHEVAIGQQFAVGRFAVTFNEWQIFADAKERRMPDDERWGQGRRPVINVSWGDAHAYIEWLTERTGERYRLLSEAEWEYCCRAGTSSSFSTGDQITSSQAQFYEAEERSTVEVGSFSSNAWGLHDMHGNVLEWCEDHWHDNYDGAPIDGSAWCRAEREMGRRVVRGGSWYNDPRLLRSASRNGLAATFRSYDLGFRLARRLNL